MIRSSKETLLYRELSAGARQSISSPTRLGVDRLIGKSIRLTSVNKSREVLCVKQNKKSGTTILILSSLYETVGYFIFIKIVGRNF